MHTVGRAALALVSLSMACTRSPEPPASETARDASVAELGATPSNVAAAPLAGEWLQPLDDDEGRGLGSVSIPVGAREPRRIVVAVHGAASRPDWMCSTIRASIGPEAFVICPHPVPRFTTEASWSTAAQMRERIDAAVGTVAHRFAPYVDLTDALYVGHSQGAMIAPTALALRGKARFRYAIFFEGLPRDTGAAKTALVGAGMHRLLLISGQGGWKNAHARFAESFEGTPLVSKHVHVDVGHFFDGRVHHLIREEMDWLVGDRAAWATGADSAVVAIGAGDPGRAPGAQPARGSARESEE